jgi:hypothetical protein
VNKSTTLGLKALIKFSIGTTTNCLGPLIIPGTSVGLVACGVGVGAGAGNRGLVIKLFGRTEAVGVGVGVGVGVEPPPDVETGAVTVVATELDAVPGFTEFTALSVTW